MKSLSRRRLKPDTSQTIALAARTKQTIQKAASEIVYALPFLTQNGVEYMDVTLDDPCSLLASNDDPDDAASGGIEGLDWDRVDMALLANCTSMPSGSPSYGGGTSTLAVCSSSGSISSIEKENNFAQSSVVVTYVYKVQTDAGVVSPDEFLEEMEGRILNEMKSKMCGGSHGGIEGTAGESGSGESSSGTSFSTSTGESSIGGEGSGSNGGSISEGLGESSSGSSSSENDDSTTGLGIVSIDSSPDDVHITNAACEATSPDADNCFIIDGAITITIDGSSDPMATEETAREYIIDTMNSGSLIDPTAMPGVVEVDYLGETYADYLFNEGGGSSIECPSVPSNVTSTKEVLVSYVYEVETASGASSSMFLPKLEGKILKEIVMETCQNDGYTLLSIKSAPDDVKVSTGRCTIESPGADACHVIDGALTVEVDSSSNSTAAEESIRESIASAMDNNYLLDSSAMPEVIDVQYLNKTYEEYIKSTTVKSITCDVSDLFVVSSNATVDTSKVTVMYLYEVETVNVTSTSAFLPVLEETILMNIGEKCEMLGMYGVLGIESTPDDKEMKEGPCSIESSSADNCFVIEGALTLGIVSSFNSTWAEEQTQSIIKSSMDNDELLNSTTLPEVIKVSHLDNTTYGDYMGGLSSDQSEIVVVENDEDQNNLGIIIGVLLGFICLILLALLFLHKKRKSRRAREEREQALRKKQAIMEKEMELDLEDALDDLVADLEGATAARSEKESDDPNGHFHLGNHHYTADGVRYFAPNCAMCVAAKARGALDEQGSHLEEGEDDYDFDELSYDINATKKFRDFNFYDLGKNHSSMHVRECKSKTCQGCKSKDSVVFIQAKSSAPTPLKSPENKSVML